MGLQVLGDGGTVLQTTKEFKSVFQIIGFLRGKGKKIEIVFNLYHWELYLKTYEILFPFQFYYIHALYMVERELVDKAEYEHPHGS